ncbi:MAG: O-antigen ligase family protein [Saprospiraceae bacterium]|nr:O-antigen ligase family protein [Saprospiraceae bacterium]
MDYLKFTELSWSRRIFLLGCFLFAAGLCWSNFLLSIGSMCFFLSLFFPNGQTRDQQSTLQNFNHFLGALRTQPYTLFIILYFITVLISGLWSSHLDDYWFQLKMLLPMLIMPLAWARHQQIRSMELQWIIRIFILSCLVVSMFVLGRYFSNFEEYNLSLLKGKAIPTPISHIRFSLMMALCALLLFKSFFDQSSFFHPWLDRMGFLYFFYLIHALSVKSGMVALYLALLSFVAIWCFRRKLWKKGLLFLIALFLIGLLAFYISPSLQNKYYYTIWQIGEMYRGKWLFYSDLERLKSIQAGWEMIKENPVLGSGAGDRMQATRETYMRIYNHQDIKLPHNQFLFSWAFYGVFNFVVLLLLMYFSLLRTNSWKTEYIPSMQIIVWSSMLYEHSLNTQVGIALFMFSYLLAHLALHPKPDGF